MVAQLHLALVMAVEAKLLVLDEPTLGLAILYRKQFYDSLLNDYFDGSRTIVVTTHQVDEIQNVLTDLVFIDRGRIALECSMENSTRAISKCWCIPGKSRRRMGAERLFRLSIADDLLTDATVIVLIWALYVVLRPISRVLAFRAVLFRLTENAVLCLATVNSLVVLRLLSGSKSFQAFETGHSMLWRHWP